MQEPRGSPECPPHIHARGEVPQDTVSSQSVLICSRWRQHRISAPQWDNAEVNPASDWERNAGRPGPPLCHGARPHLPGPARQCSPSLGRRMLQAAFTYVHPQFPSTNTTQASPSAIPTPVLTIPRACNRPSTVAGGGAIQGPAGAALSPGATEQGGAVADASLSQLLKSAKARGKQDKQGSCLLQRGTGVAGDATAGFKDGENVAHSRRLVSDTGAQLGASPSVLLAQSRHHAVTASPAPSLQCPAPMHAENGTEVITGGWRWGEGREQEQQV